MAGFEDLLRSALAKQENPSAGIRQRIYQSSRDALERMIQQRSDMTAETIALQRQQLEAAIVEVELSMTGAPAAPSAAAPSLEPSQPSSPAPAQPRATQTAPSTVSPAVQEPPVQPAAPPPSPTVAVSAPPVRQPTFAPAPEVKSAATAPQLTPIVPPIPASTPTAEELAPYDPPGETDFDGNPIDERKPYAKMLFWAIILCGLGVSVWWLVSFGPDLLRSRLDGSVPNPRPTIESRGPGATDDQAWLSVFAAGVNPENIVTGTEGRAELIRSGESTFARISSNRGTDNRIRFVVPAGIMERIKGRAATFEMSMQAVDGEQQFPVYCEFGAMGSCGRKRFQIDGRLQPFIFDVLVNDTTLASGEQAYLAVNTDLGGTGKGIDLSSIRVRIDR